MGRAIFPELRRNVYGGKLEPVQVFERSELPIQEDAKSALELLSTGFEVSWFRVAAPRIWTAIVKPLESTRDHFGLRQECFVIGHAFPKDFHERTLLQGPPADVEFRVDPQVRLVVSKAPLAEASCAAWAARHKMSIVLLTPDKRPSNESQEEYLYRLLSIAFWRRDLFAESEPVRLRSEFFGRETAVNEVLSHIVSGSPVAVFGLRKIGKSSLLARVIDLLEADESSLTATTVLLGNSARIRGGRWWVAATDVLSGLQQKLLRFATSINSPKAAGTNYLVNWTWPPPR